MNKLPNWSCNALHNNIICANLLHSGSLLAILCLLLAAAHTDWCYLSYIAPPTQTPDLESDKPSQTNRPPLQAKTSFLHSLLHFQLLQNSNKLTISEKKKRQNKFFIFQLFLTSFLSFPYKRTLCSQEKSRNQNHDRFIKIIEYWHIHIFMQSWGLFGSLKKVGYII